MSVLGAVTLSLIIIREEQENDVDERGKSENGSCFLGL